MFRFSFVDKKKMVYYLLALIFLYANITITFAFMYIVLDFANLGQLIDHYDHATNYFESEWMSRFTTSLYFSAVTLFSVGYGDITPFGLAKLFAIIEAMIGYILPAAFVIQYLRYTPFETTLEYQSKKMDRHD